MSSRDIARKAGGENTADGGMKARDREIKIRIRIRIPILLREPNSAGRTSRTQDDGSTRPS
jgi:hypothetical protein